MRFFLLRRTSVAVFSFEKKSFFSSKFGHTATAVAVVGVAARLGRRPVAAADRRLDDGVDGVAAAGAVLLLGVVFAAAVAAVRCP